MLPKVLARSGVALVATALLVLAAVPAVRAQGPPDVLWVRQFGTTKEDEVFAASVDTAGVHVVGGTLGAFPGFTNPGERDAFVRTYDVDGNETWTRQFGTTATDRAQGVVGDATGVYVAGGTGGALPGQASAGGADAFLRKYDAAGNEVWTRQFGTASSDWAYGVAADAAGLYVAGETYGTFPGQTNLGAIDGFLRKYDRDGNEAWTRQFGGAGMENARAVAADGTGVYVAGVLWNLTLGGFVSVWKFDPDGNGIWTRTLLTAPAPSMANFASGVAATAARVYVAGWTCSTLPNETALGLCDAFLWALDPDGNTRWGRQFGTPFSDSAMAVAADATGAVVTGYTYGTFPGETSAGLPDAFLRKYDPDGNVAWTRQFGTWGEDVGIGIAGDASGLYVAGTTSGVFPGETAMGRYDAFVMKWRAALGGPAGPCPLSQGHWKNHAGAWPVDSLRLGGTDYGRADLLALLRTPPRGDASLILAHQLIAAKLNVANGSDAAPIAATLSEADALLSAHAGTLPYGVRSSTPEGRAMTAAAETLDAYNNGGLTPGCAAGAGGGGSGTGNTDDAGPPGEATGSQEPPGSAPFSGLLTASTAVSLLGAGMVALIAVRLSARPRRRA